MHIFMPRDGKHERDLLRRSALRVPANRSATSGLGALLRRLAAQDSSPKRLGVAVGLGVLFACTPFFGLQLILALIVAWPLRLNKLAVAIGTQLSLPPLIPVIGFVSVNIGELILRQRAVSLTLTQIGSTPASAILEQIGLAWTVGGIVVGLLAGSIIGGTVSVVAMRMRVSSASDTPPATENL